MYFLGSASDFVARLEQLNCQGADAQKCDRDHRQTDPRGNVALAKETVSETVNHVEEGIQVT
jgi:negative regulator of replication initiation